ncbi:hypothetical protein CN163_34830 [Sinorhizobium meliloti]|nr:hypothetical protein CN163_34830 [Sinorhizobium meliloti]
MHPATPFAHSGEANSQTFQSGETDGRHHRSALFAWRSAVWTYSTAELVKVLAGERPQRSVEEFMAELPVFQWPQF